MTATVEMRRGPKTSFDTKPSVPFEETNKERWILPQRVDLVYALEQYRQVGAATDSEDLCSNTRVHDMLCELLCYSMRAQRSYAGMYAYGKIVGM